jgi:hypothetical protein
MVIYRIEGGGECQSAVQQERRNAKHDESTPLCARRERTRLAKSVPLIVDVMPYRTARLRWGTNRRRYVPHQLDRFSPASLSSNRPAILLRLCPRNLRPNNCEELRVPEKRLEPGNASTASRRTVSSQMPSGCLRWLLLRKIAAHRHAETLEKFDQYVDRTVDTENTLDLVIGRPRISGIQRGSISRPTRRGGHRRLHVDHRNGTFRCRETSPARRFSTSGSRTKTPPTSKRC